MTSKNKFRYVCLFLSIAVFLVVIIRKQKKNKVRETKTELVSGETIRQPVDSRQFIPVEEVSDPVPVLPVKETEIIYRDTGSIQTEIRYILQTVDTTAIIADYIKKRSYELTVFDNKEQGCLQLFPTVQYNTLTGLNVEYTPVIRQTTITKQKVWTPFLGASYSTFNYVGIGAGIFYHNIGLEYQYQRDYLKAVDGHEIGIKCRF